MSTWRAREWAPAQRDDTWGLDLPQWSHVKTGPQDGSGRTVIFDIEGDGLLEAQGSKRQGTKLWCVGAIDVETREKFYWGWEQGGSWIEHALQFLASCKRTMAHHGIGYDYPYLERHAESWTGSPWQRPEEAWDTEVIAKVIWPYDVLIGPDLARIRAGKMPGQYLKRHSLAAWGYRTGTHKVEYSGGFEEWCPAMATYLMTGDLDGPMALWELAKKRMNWADPVREGEPVWPELTLWTEHEVARIIFDQEMAGVRFDLPRAQALAAELRNEQARIEKELIKTFGSWWQPLADPEVGIKPARGYSRKLEGEPWVTLPRFSEKTGKRLADYHGPPMEHYSQDAPFVPVEWTTFNPSSRDHLGMRLQAVYGWKPSAFGANGKPTVDESTLSEIPDAVIPAETRQLILDYFVVSKTLGTLSKGKKSWIGMCREDDQRIHGQMDTCGAVTRRGTHKNPNLSGTPAVRKEKGPDGVEHPVRGLPGRYGWECRELFIADEGWELTGVDASSLELIDLGHYLFPLDEGAFSERVCDPTRDPHAEHAVICGTTRGDAKTTIYLKVYGGSSWKLSLERGIVVKAEQVPELLGYRGLPMLLKSVERRFGPEFVAKLGDMQRARLSYARQVIVKLEAGIPGLKTLTDDVTAAAARGWLKAMDGSRIHVRKAHAALNALLQSAGAISCKLWMALVHQKLKSLGLKPGVDFKQVLWVHDELQFTHRPGLGPTIKQVAEECLVLAGEMLGLRGRYRTDGKTAGNWAETH